MLRGIDISNWQSGLSIDLIKDKIDFVICKATEGVSFVDNYCDKSISRCISLNIPRGFYHVMTSATGPAQAEFFYKNCMNYFHNAIPVLDIEGYGSYPNDPGRAYDFCNSIIKWTGVPPILYMNGSCIASADYSSCVSLGCGLWLANYPAGSKSFEWAEQNTSKMYDTGEWPFAAMWQFTSTGRLDGYNGDLDFDLFFGDVEAWNKYAGVNEVNEQHTTSVLENDKYKVTIEEK